MTHIASITYTISPASNKKRLLLDTCIISTIYYKQNQLLDRVEIGHIDLGTDIQTWAIYKFNKDKFLQEYQNFQIPAYSMPRN